MLFAELDAQGWAIIIGALAMGVLQILTVILNYLQAQTVNRDASLAAEGVNQARLEAQRAAERVEDVRLASVKAAAVREKAVAMTDAVLTTVATNDAKTDKLLDVIEVIHKVVNSKADALAAKAAETEAKLLEATTQLAELRGMVSRERAEDAAKIGRENA